MYIFYSKSYKTKAKASHLYITHYQCCMWCSHHSYINCIVKTTCEEQSNLNNNSNRIAIQ